MIVLDSNILIRAVLGRSVPDLIDTYAAEGVGGEFLKSRGDGCLIESATVPLPPV